MINICNEINKSSSGSKVNGGETLLSYVDMMRPDTHPAYQGGDGPSEPIVDVESQEAAHWDKETLWGEHTRALRVYTTEVMSVYVCIVCYVLNAAEIYFDHWREGRYYPIFERILFWHLQWQLGRRTEWLWTRTSRRMPSPRSKNEKVMVFLENTQNII